MMSQNVYQVMQNVLDIVSIMFLIDIRTEI